MSFKTCGNKFEFTGHINNLFSYLFEEKHTLFINGSVFSPNIMIDSLFAADTNNEQEKINFPRDLNLKINIKSDEFSWDRFRSKNLSGILNYHNKTLL